jgi:hypothetical protein
LDMVQEKENGGLAIRSWVLLIHPFNYLFYKKLHKYSSWHK